MRSPWYAILVAAALGAAQAPAQATCFFVFDRGDNTIYRGTQPPVDMSERGAAERDAMRARGEYLLFIETDACAPITFLTGPGTPGTLSVDAIVAGIPTMAKSEGGSTGLVSGTKGATQTGASAKRATPATRSSAPAKKY